MIYDKKRSDMLREWAEEFVKDFHETRKTRGDEFVKDSIELLVKITGPLSRNDDPILQSIGQMVKFGVATLCISEEPNNEQVR